MVHILTHIYICCAILNTVLCNNTGPSGKLDRVLPPSALSEYGEHEFDNSLYNMIDENNHRTCSHRLEPDDEAGYTVINVEDPDKQRRPYLYLDNTIANQYRQYHKPGTKAVIIVGIILLGISTASGVMICCRTGKKDVIPL
ncbi:putative integral membrane protein [Babesia bovis T2Bo]|uniref:putative integral membrane protein n=1 Tax=Babesia bovis T2Bo TaxID=484906 RepID=UPI001C3459BF|nr:putative integral membrane protein [Babesia bovis T2Bo]KAG6440069.1 putative integral membrane protein [Babesia bovis T2Bo]